MYILEIQTGFYLPTGEIDSVITQHEALQDVIELSKVFIEQGYTVVIRLEKD